MCDTLYRKTLSKTIFGKNSDRSANEPNLCLYYPAKMEEENLQTTYINVGKVNRKHAIMLVQPSWMWGGEMGINDAGVVIGNEAVFTKSTTKKQEKLLGMDLLRLSLEQSSTAMDAANTIIEYLEKFGQGGNCGFDKKFYYDNSFLIADNETAYILETSGYEWVLKEIKDFGNISNCLSITNDYVKASSNYHNFSKSNTEPIFTYFSKARVRGKTIYDQLKDSNNTISKTIEILTSHHPDYIKKLYSKGSVRSVCMHQSMLGDHTTGSMIVDFHKPFPTIWLTGCSTPCLAIYKPTYFGITIPPIFTKPKDSLEYWLEREYLVRAIYGGLVDLNEYKLKQSALQMQLIKEEEELFKGEVTKEDLEVFALKCSNLEQKFIDSYKDKINIVEGGNARLPKLWKKKTPKLNLNPFLTNYQERNRK